MFSEGSVRGRVISIGDPGGHGISGKLRCVEVVVAIVAARYEFPAESVSGATPKAAFSFYEIAGILMKDGRKEPKKYISLGIQ